ACKRVIKKALKEAGIRQFSQSETQSGKNNPSWKGGRTKLGLYLYIYMPDHPYATKHGYVAEHRLIVEQLIGRCLEPDEVVHHKDGNPENNDPENLQLFSSNAEHLARELKGRVPKWTDAGRQRILEGIRKPRNLTEEYRERR